MAVSFNRSTYCYNSCITLKPVHFHLVPDFKVDPNTLYMLLQLRRHKHNTIPYKVKMNSS
jgi:hypothetical protein